MRLVGVVSKNLVASKFLAGRRNLFRVVYILKHMIQHFTTLYHIQFQNLYLRKHIIPCYSTRPSPSGDCCCTFCNGIKLRMEDLFLELNLF